MVYGLRSIRDSLYEAFSKALSRIQERNSKAKLSFETIKIIRGLTILSISGVLAFTSHSLSEQSGIQEWRQTHWPEKKVWELLLHHQGLSRKEHLDDYSRLFKNATALVTDIPTLWITEDGCAIYIHRSPFRDTPEFWVCEEKPKASRWVSLGGGFAAFEQLIHILEANGRESRTVTKRAIPIDPKELRY